MARTAVIAGVGPGLGESIARRFAAEGLDLGLLARSADYLDELAEELEADHGIETAAVPTDLAEVEQIDAAFDAVRGALGPVDVLVNHASGGAWKGVRALEPAEMEHALRVGPLGGLRASQHAVEDMLAGDGGTVIFTGATSSVRGNDGAAAFSAAKFAVRGLAESMARDLGPEGVHVAHVVIDGQILPPSAEGGTAGRDEEEFLDPDAIADTYWHLVEQDRSSWSLEVDVRPHVEAF
ncbi:MAG: SDR family NAD(P)-dependent oxidoreductase [Halobacteriales archaeon]|nr:SDR family NAD(P)-dependent oxidoreductase [Halobacteriales archaeon]